MASKTKMITQSEEDFTPKREAAQKFTFAQLQELIQRNVAKNINRTYTQYTKDAVKGYLQNPGTSLDYIREISRFLERNSVLYRKILTYYAATPLFYYNLTQENDLSKTINKNKSIKDFYTVAKQVNGFNIAKEMFNVIYCTVRDGMYVGYTYSNDESAFFMPLDIKYCRIYGKSESGEWITYFDASYFKSGNNSIYVEGVDGDGIGVWDDVFVQGWKDYQKDNNKRWFRLPPEKTFTLISGSDDQFDVPLPLLAGIFVSLMDLADLESIIASKTELENYKLLISKIPLFDGTEEVDDFALSLELVKQMQALIDEAVPELVGTAISPMELDVIDFNKSNTTDDTDTLANSINNLFNNAGVSQLVVAGGSSSNSVGLKHALQNDMSNIWVYVNRIESWLNYYIKMNISEGYRLKIHHITWYNREEYQTSMKEVATLGGSAMDYLTSMGDTPYVSLQKLNFENAIGVKDLMIPLTSTYTQSSKGGAPTKNEDDLSSEGISTRDGNKNGTN